MDDPLQNPVQFVPGVGPRRAALLARLDIATVEDLLTLIPREVIDLGTVSDVTELTDTGNCTVRGRVEHVETRSISGQRKMVAALVRCQQLPVRCLFFNQPWMQQQLQRPGEVLVTGKPRLFEGRWEFSHPRLQWLDEGATAASISVRYPLTEGLKQPELARVMEAALARFLPQAVDVLPADFRATLSLPSFSAALTGLHRPGSVAEFEQARRRIVLDDLLEFQIGIALRRRFLRREPARAAIAGSARLDARIRRLFPFEFTAGQNAAIADIMQDLAGPGAMHRLLQADVGAGKTAVALYAMLAAVAAGFQTVLMAPTEILAEQHWQTVHTSLAESRVRRARVTGSLKPAERKALLAQIAAGEIDLIVGTQAVIQKGVTYRQLGLVVIDEQHRFGVQQRAALFQETLHPHLLVMTATPIPRSLCLTAYGDLDLSIVRDLPPGRLPIHTARLSEPSLLQNAWSFIREQLTSGRQLFVVCPRIDGATDDDTSSVLAAYEQLRRDELAGFRVGLLHGRLTREEQDAVMAAFRDGDVQALVATTIVEVGVDVPNATLMVVRDAQRFGLAQLHQLRGRVGRGRFRGYCFLIAPPVGEGEVDRLAVLESSADGFAVAEEDFRQRGPGDVLGTRQSGQLPLRRADLVRDGELLEIARKMAWELVHTGGIDGPEFSRLRARVYARFERVMDLPRTG